MAEALIKTLTPALINNTSLDFFRGKLHVFLMCRALSKNLSNVAIPEKTAKLLEETALQSTMKSMTSGVIEIWQLQILFKELPKILPLNYPVVGDIKNACQNLLSQLIMQYRLNEQWQRYREYEYLLEMLKTIK